MLLSTDRLNIVLYKDGELSNFDRWLEDPEVVRYSELRHGVGKSIAGRDTRPNERWMILLEGREIGRLGVTFDPPNNTADLSILMGEKDYWGQGYGTEAWIAMLEHLLKTNRKVTAGTMAVNIGMRRILNKSGMQYDGMRMNQFLLDGEPVDLYLACKFA